MLPSDCKLAFAAIPNLYPLRMRGWCWRYRGPGLQKAPQTFATTLMTMALLVVKDLRNALSSEIAVSLGLEEKYGNIIWASSHKIGKRGRTVIGCKSEELHVQ